jgi:membrane protein YdbS with pleckstrin-like domain
LVKEVKLLEFTITAKQLIAVIWTLIAIVLSIVIVIGIGNYYNSGYPQQWVLVALFFVLLLIITLPVYLLLALWQALTKSESS